MSSRLAPSLAAASALLIASGAAAQTPEVTTPEVAAPADWGQALRQDTQAFHDLIADSHPGPVDAENPGFGALLEGGLRTALERAGTADSYEDWYFALNEYQASFDDGHLNLHAFAKMGHEWRHRWPGFLTGLRADAEGREQHAVVFSQEASGPPLGAVLVQCDGRPADALAADVVGRSAGRWNLTSRRASFASTLFVDQQNPYVARPETCVFEVDGRATTYRLAWRDLPNGARDEGFAAARTPRHAAPIEMRDWSGGTWISLGGFDGDPNGADGKRLIPLQAEIEAKTGAIRGAPRVVFDLRGNNGGSSAWINAMAKTLWGEAWVEAKAPRSDGVDWRASADNLATIESYKVRFAERPEMMEWLTEITDGLTRARAEGRELWRQGREDEAVPPTAPATEMKAEVFVLTDFGCASACLDAVDLLKALGATQVGQETSADTLYMEVRSVPLPGGRVRATVPMKVYRGRARGSNAPATPTHVWTGALSDTAGIEAWIAGLRP